MILTADLPAGLVSAANNLAPNNPLSLQCITHNPDFRDLPAQSKFLAVSRITSERIRPVPRPSDFRP